MFVFLEQIFKVVHPMEFYSLDDYKILYTINKYILSTTNKIKYILFKNKSIAMATNCIYFELNVKLFDKSPVVIKLLWDLCGITMYNIILALIPAETRK